MRYPSENKAITMLRKELSQRATLAVNIGNNVAFINDNDVPMCILQYIGVVVFKRIDRNNRLVVILKRILELWNL